MMLTETQINEQRAAAWWNSLNADEKMTAVAHGRSKRYLREYLKPFSRLHSGDKHDVRCAFLAVRS